METRVRAELGLEPQESRRTNEIGSGLNTLSALSGGFVHSYVVVCQALSTCTILCIPPSWHQALFRKELPFGCLGELETIFDGIFEEPVESARRRGRFSPDEIITKEITLLAKPEYQFILEGTAFIAVSFRTIVQDKTAVWFQLSENFGRHIQEKLTIPPAVVLFAILILRLSVIRWRGDDQINTLVWKRTQERQAVANVQRAEICREGRFQLGWILRKRKRSRGPILSLQRGTIARHLLRERTRFSVFQVHIDRTYWAIALNGEGDRIDAYRPARYPGRAFTVAPRLTLTVSRCHPSLATPRGV